MTPINATSMRKLIVHLLLLLLSAESFSQDNMFVVYSTKGKVSVIENKTETKAKIGTLLNDNSSIQVETASFATLICNETRMFTLNKPGMYSLGKLKDSCKTTKTGSVSSNYMKYIWNELTKSKGSPEKNRKAYMSNVGAVSRSINNVWIDPKLDTVYYVSGNFPLSWKSFTEADNFDFRVFSAETGEQPLISKSTGKKHVMVAELLDKIKEGKSYWWTAMVKGENNEEKKYFRYWTKDEYNKFYKSLKKGSASETDAESHFHLGFLLEEAHFLAEAEQHYFKATQLAPDVVLYRSTFMSFKKDYEIK